MEIVEEKDRNVLHICSYYIGSKLYKNLIKSLDEIGIKNTVYIPINSCVLYEKNYVEGLTRTEFIYSKCFNNIDRINFKLKISKIYDDLKKRVNMDKINFVHAHSLFVNGYLAYKLKKEYGLDYIVAVRNTDLNVFLKYMPWMRKLGIKIMKESKNVIFISHAYKEQVLEKYVDESIKLEIEKKSVVVPNGVDKFWLENMSSEDKNNKSYKAIYIGTIDKNKNIITTINAISLLRNQGYDIKFDIIGEGKEKNKILKLVNKKHKNYISIHKYMTKEKLIEKYRESDIFIMPSITETFGLVYVEALTQGVPIIYTKNQGFDGFFKDGEVGFAVSPKDITEISEKIKYLIENKINLDKLENKIKVEFDWRNIVKTYIKMYFN